MSHTYYNYLAAERIRECPPLDTELLSPDSGLHIATTYDQLLPVSGAIVKSISMDEHGKHLALLPSFFEANGLFAFAKARRRLENSTRDSLLEMLGDISTRSLVDALDELVERSQTLVDLRSQRQSRG